MFHEENVGSEPSHHIKSKLFKVDTFPRCSILMHNKTIYRHNKYK